MGIDGILRAWGRWANGRVGTEYPCVAAGMRLAVEPTRYLNEVKLTEESCILIGDQIARLKEKADLRYEILMAKYALRIVDEEIWRVLNISRAAYFNELAKAKSYMEGAIEGAQILAYFYA